MERKDSSPWDILKNVSNSLLITVGVSVLLLPLAAYILSFTEAPESHIKIVSLAILFVSLFCGAIYLSTKQRKLDLIPATYGIVFALILVIIGALINTDEKSFSMIEKILIFTAIPISCYIPLLISLKNNQTRKKRKKRR